MSIEGQGHFFTIYFVLYLDKISGERLQDHWSSGIISRFGFEGWIWVLIASVPGLCILFTFKLLTYFCTKT